MLDNLLGRSNFKTKCKSALSRTKTRLEVIKKKRNAMVRFLKKDIADLLKSNLELNAYGRAEGLYVELNLSSCYEYVEECCTFISEHLKEMHKQSECPEGFRVAVASLIYAAARFADLPDLRDLRMHFYDKYGQTWEPYISNKEFLDKLKSKPPTMEMKLQLMHDIAKEFSVVWDSNSLEQQLRNPTKSTNDQHGDGRKYSRSRSSASVQMKDKKDNEDNKSNGGANLRHTHSWAARIHDKHQDEPNYDEIINRNSFTNRTVPAPYTLPSKADSSGTPTTMSENDDSSSTSTQKQADQNPDKPKPRSVRTKFLRPSHSSVATSQTTNFGVDAAVKETLSARAPTTSFGSPAVSELPLPPGKRRYLFSEEGTSLSFKENERNTKSSEFPFCPGWSKFLPPNFDEPMGRHRKCETYGNDGSYGLDDGKFPDFDELAERIAALRNTHG